MVVLVLQAVAWGGFLGAIFYQFWLEG